MLIVFKIFFVTYTVKANSASPWRKKSFIMDLMDLIDPMDDRFLL